MDVSPVFVQLPFENCFRLGLGYPKGRRKLGVFELDIVDGYVGNMSPVD